MSKTGFTVVLGREELEEEVEEEDCELSPATTAAATENTNKEEKAITKRTPPAILTSKNLD
jgi:hypothetical protein